MTWIWLLLGALAGVAGLRHRSRLHAARASGGPPRVDDEAVRQILERGTLAAPEEDDEPLDLEEAAQAEEEFWRDSWDEPEEYER